MGRVFVDEQKIVFFIFYDGLNIGIVYAVKTVAKE